MVDKIIIFAGGISSRMKLRDELINNLEFSIIKDADEKQKAMIGLGEHNRPFLDYLLYNIRLAGLKDVLIVISEKDESIKNYYGTDEINTNFEGLNIRYAIQPIPVDRKKPLGTADALFHALIAVPSWKDSSFLVCNSDNLYSVQALKILINSPYPNALIDYDSEGLIFDAERIKFFAITQKSAGGFLTDIIEKPSEAEVQQAKGKDGFIGISMNLFKFTYRMIFPCLEITPFHPERNEKELPDSVKIMIAKYPDSVFTYRMKEHVPDLTSKRDILPVQEYLKKEFSKKAELWEK